MVILVAGAMASGGRQEAYENRLEKQKKRGNHGTRNTKIKLQNVLRKIVKQTLVFIVFVNATRCPTRPDKDPTTCDRQPAKGSKLHKIVDL